MYRKQGIVFFKQASKSIAQLK